MLADLGVRAGFVWKKDSDGWQRINASRRFSAYNVPVTIVDPGPDGNAATTADNGPNLQPVQPRRRCRGRRNQVTENMPGYEGTYKTLEFSANKRYGNRWSMNASFSYTWTEEFGNLYFNNRFGTAVPGGSFSLFGSYPAEPERADAQRVHQLEREVLRHGRRRLGPARHAGAEDAERRARTAASSRPRSTTTRQQIVLVEPIGTRRQDTSRVLDFRVEKQLRFAADRAQRRPVLRPVQRHQLEHRGEHQLAVGRGLRKGDDGPRTAHRQVRREVRLVSRIADR